jgi:enterochelin esterase family protein
MALLLPLARTAIAQPPAMAVVSPEVDAGRRITFRLLAPNAKEVSVHGEFTRAAIPMAKDEKGVWSASVGPVRPDVYGYGFHMDGLNLPDPCNTFVRVGSLAYESQVYVPGEEADFLATREVPHGALHEHWYFSKRLNTTRRVVVYTPPGYDARGGPYPVLYLLHGMGASGPRWAGRTSCSIICWPPKRPARRWL